MPIVSRQGGWARPVVAKTGNYTVKATDCGTLFTNRGAGAGITFTLPTPSAENNGVWFEFVTVAAQTLAVSLTSKLIVHANATATSVTTAATIGQHLNVVCDGTGWFVQSDPSAATTATAVTAVTIA